MKRKSKMLNIRISKTLKSELFRVAEALDVPASQIIREAVRQKILKMRAGRPVIERTVTF